MKKRKKVWSLMLMALVLLTGCGSANKSYTGTAANDAYYPAYDSGEIYVEENGYPSEMLDSTTGSTTSENVRAGRKLIRTADLSVETLEFDKLLDYVEARTEELGGYVESMNVYNGSNYSNYSYSGTGYRNDRSASLILRIPSANMDNFLTAVAENSNITSRSEQEKDVTLDYVDLDSHKKVLLAEQERLLALMEQAETMEDIITLESRLSDIRYQIESMESMLRTYDNQIEYSTIYLDISEVVVLTPVPTKEMTVWERIGEGFMNSLENIGNGFKEFFVGFVIAIPYLLLLAAFIAVLTVIIVISVKKGTARHQKKLAAMQEQQRMYMQQMQYAQNGQQMYPVQSGQPVQPGVQPSQSDNQKREQK